MLLLVSGATATVRRYASSPYLGHLLTPRNGNKLETLLATGLPLAADNDCFQRLDRPAYLAMLRTLAPHAARVLWVTVPDVVADARATLVRFRLWLPALRFYGLPVALVAQDGQEALPVPWDALACLFIGGSTAWKEGPHAAALIREAKARGKLVHVGRVNTQRRMRYVDALGADSFDGTQFSRFSETYIPRWLAMLGHRQHGLDEALWM